MWEQLVRCLSAGRVAILLAGGLASAGCFGYVPADPGALPVGSEVRVHLTREGLASLPEVPDSVVSGTVLRNGGPRLTLRVPVATRMDGVVTRSIGRDVTIPTAHAARVERRQLDRARTVLTVVGAAATAVLAVQAFGDAGPDANTPPWNPPEEQSRVPLHFVPNSIP